MTFPASPSHDPYLHHSYELIKAVHDNLDAIRKVASHLTPVEDLVEFQSDVEQLHAQLGLLVEASGLIVQASPAGVSLLLAADTIAQRALLGLGTAALSDAATFAAAVDLTALQAVVGDLSALVDQAVLDIGARVTQPQLAAAIDPLLVRLAALEADTGPDTRIDQILDDLAGGTYNATIVSDLAALTVRVTSTEQGIGGLATASQALTARVTQTEDGLAVQVGQTTSLATQVSNLETGQAAASTAVQALTTRTETLEGTVTSQSDAITTLTARADNAETGLASQASAVDSLSIRVTDTETAQSVTSAAVTQLDSRIVDAESGLAAHGNALDSLTTSIEQTDSELVIAGEQITALTASVTSVGNLLPNSAFEADLRGWTLFSKGAGWLSSQLQRDLEPERLPTGVHALCVSATGVPGGSAGIRSTNIPVEALSTQILSGYLAAENCTLKLEWRLLNSAGVEIGFGIAGQVTDSAPSTNLQGWPRMHAAIPIPVDGALLQVQAWVTDCHVGPPKAWLVRPQVEEAVGVQTGPSPWTPSITGIEELLATAVQELTVRIEQTEDLVDVQAGSVTELVSRIGALAEWRITTHMGSGTFDTVGAPLPPTLRRLGAEIPAYTFLRGLTLVRFTPAGELMSATQYDTYSTPSQRDALRDALNALGPSQAFVLVAQNHHGIKQADLTAAIENAGGLGFASVLGSRPYILFGRGQLGKGGGIEVFPANGAQWIDHTFTLVNDTPKGLGENAGVQEALAVQATAVDSLNTRVTSVEGEVTAVSEAQLALDARMETAESALVQEIVTSANKNAAVTASINTLTARMEDVEADASGAVTAVQGLEGRVTSVEGTVTSQGSSITNLQAQVNALDVDAGGSGAAIAALDTRVTQNEADITSQGNAITSLQNSVTSANKVFVQDTAPATSGRTDGDIWVQPSQGNKWHTLTGGQWVARQDGAKNSVFVQNTTPTAKAVNDLWVHTGDNNKLFRWNGSQWLDISDARTTANASAISSLTTRVSSAEGSISSQSQQITSLINSVHSPTTGNIALSEASSALTSRVSTVEGQTSAQASSLQTLTTTVNGNTATINTHASSINGLRATWKMQLDVNGHVTGLYSENNGTIGEFTIVADKFKVIAPGHNGRTLFTIGSNGGTQFANDMYLGNGRIILETGTHMKVQGIGFGTQNQFVEWYGPKMPIAQCAENNAIMYLKTNGSAYYGGALSAGTLKNAVQTTALVGNVNLTLGPFNTNGGAKTIVTSFSRSVSQLMQGNYNHLDGKTTTVQITIYRRLNGGAQAYFGQFNASGVSTAFYDYETDTTLVQQDVFGSQTAMDYTGGTSTFTYDVVASTVSDQLGANAAQQVLSIISTEG